MGNITDLDITGLIKAKSGAPLGDAHEIIVRGIMMRLGLEIGKVDLSSGPYDLIMTVYNRPKGKKLFLKAQVKTISGSLPLTAGSRGGRDRTYKSDVKTYKYSKKQIDVILGVDKTSLDIYIFPVSFAAKYKTSVSKNKMKVCKNNWDMLLNWNTKFLKRVEGQLIV